MRLLLAALTFALSVNTASAMAKIFDEETLKRLEQAKIDLNVIDKSVRMIGPGDEADKATRMKSCEDYWADMKRPTKDGIALIGEISFSVRIVRCMFRANYAITADRCPNAAYAIAVMLQKVKPPETEDLEEPGMAEDKALLEDDDASEEDKQEARDRLEEAETRLEQKRTEQRQARQRKVAAALADMRKPRCYAQFEAR